LFCARGIILEETRANQFIYIIQSSLEPAKCKIGKTNSLENRLYDYNHTTGISKDNIYRYLFTCEVKDDALVENDIKKEFAVYREESSREIYFYNKPFFNNYVTFIKKHKMFVKEIYCEPVDRQKIVKIVKKDNSVPRGAWTFPKRCFAKSAKSTK
jgi:hypothetical protein